jgi:putative transposase
VVVAFIDDHRARFGVEPICRVLTKHGVPIAPSGYSAFKTRPAPARAERDARLLAEIERTFHDRQLGRGRAGARKVWRLLRRQIAEGRVEADLGPVPRCTVERLMRRAGLSGGRRGGPKVITTRPYALAARPPDLVDRNFSADRPNQLWSWTSPTS